ncbi:MULTISPECIES: hypothetical protein [unclassified Ruegeria]|uniref:hypothetical protein n=1 Tax=unclassified Ruegeria TaxID=2625375 RepID=UPI001488B29F|nr:MULTISPECIES: hypothetical protein [unclassified Ruegeria]NOD62111.1 hypothetical protein [Ruegeria sp. HKCCD6109]
MRFFWLVLAKIFEFTLFATIIVLLTYCVFIAFEAQSREMLGDNLVDEINEGFSAVFSFFDGSIQSLTNKYGSAPIWSFISASAAALLLFASNALNRKHSSNLAKLADARADKNLHLQKEIFEKSRENMLHDAAEEIKRGYQTNIDRLEAELEYKLKEESRLRSEKDRADREFLLDVLEQFLVEFSVFASIDRKAPFIRQGTLVKENRDYMNAQKLLAGPVLRDAPRSNMSILYAFYLMQVIAATSLVSKSRWERSIGEDHSVFIRKVSGQISRMVKWKEMPGLSLINNEQFNVVESRMVLRDTETNSLRLMNWVEFSDAYEIGGAIARIADEISHAYRDTFSHPEEWPKNEDGTKDRFFRFSSRYSLSGGQLEERQEAELPVAEDELPQDAEPEEISEIEDNDEQGEDELSTFETSVDLPSGLFWAHERQHLRGDRLTCLCYLLQRIISYERELFGSDSVGKGAVGLRNTEGMLKFVMQRRLFNHKSGKLRKPDSEKKWFFLEFGDNAEFLAAGYDIALKKSSRKKTPRSN